MRAQPSATAATPRRRPAQGPRRVPRSPSLPPFLPAAARAARTIRREPPPPRASRAKGVPRHGGCAFHVRHVTAQRRRPEGREKKNKGFRSASMSPPKPPPHPPSRALGTATAGGGHGHRHAAQDSWPGLGTRCVRRPPTPNGRSLETQGTLIYRLPRPRRYPSMQLPRQVSFNVPSPSCRT